MIRSVVITALVGAFALGAAGQAFAQAEKRQQAMKDISAANKAVKGAVEEKNYVTVGVKAKEIMGLADSLPSLFPKGSHTGKTKAKPEIWEKSEDFNKLAKNLSKAAGDLEAAAKGGNDADVGAKFKDLGATCANCHKPYRAEKYGE